MLINTQSHKVVVTNQHHWRCIDVDTTSRANYSTIISLVFKSEHFFFIRKGIRLTVKINMVRSPGYNNEMGIGLSILDVAI